MIKPIMKSEFFLRLPSEDAGPDDAATGQDLLDTLHEHEHECVGLAANMIGVRKRIICVKDGSKSLLMYNPQILEQVNTYQMQGAQNEQSLRELQEENLRLVDENADYATQIDALNAQLSKLNSRVSTLQDSNAALQQKSAFFDAHVAFVENDGTGYYHKYGCDYFAQTSFWAYSRKLAEANGYTPCPHCFG